MTQKHVLMTCRSFIYNTVIGIVMLIVMLFCIGPLEDVVSPNMRIIPNE